MTKIMAVVSDESCISDFPCTATYCFTLHAWEAAIMVWQKPASVATIKNFEIRTTPSLMATNTQR